MEEDKMQVLQDIQIMGMETVIEISNRILVMEGRSLIIMLSSWTGLK